MDGIGLRLREKRLEKGMTLQAVGDVFGINKSSVVNWERGVSRPDMQKIQGLARLFGVSIEYLLQGVQVPQMPIMSNLEKIEVRMIPVLSWVQAGNWTEASTVTKQDVIEWIPSDKSIGANGFALIVKGESMAPYYVEGDRIHITPDIQKDSLHDGDLVVAVCNGDATFKKLVIDGRKYFLKALNDSFGGRTIIELDEDCKILGLVVGSYRPTKRRGNF